MMRRKIKLAIQAGVLLLLLAGCAASSGGGPVATLPTPPETIAPFGGDRHVAALADPKLRAAMLLDTRDDFTGAAAAYRVAGDAGNPIGHYLLGKMYEAGDGVPRDRAEAARQFQLGALAGYAPAQLYLGDAYEKGLGVPRDQATANRWYRFAAEQGEDIATSRLSKALIEGDGIATDVPTALRLLKQCAEPGGGENVYHPSGASGGPGCQAYLGILLVEGKNGIPADTQQGLKLLTLSAQQGFKLAAAGLAKIYQEGVPGVAADSQQAAYWRDQTAKAEDHRPGDWMQL